MVSEGVEVESPPEMFARRYLGDPVAPENPVPYLLSMYWNALRGMRAESAWSSRFTDIPAQQRDALWKTIQHGFKDRHDIVVSELFLREFHEEISLLLYKVGHWRHHQVQMVSDGSGVMVHRARLVLSKRRIRAEIKINYGPGPDWYQMSIPILEKGEEE